MNKWMLLIVGALALGILAWWCAPHHAAAIQTSLLAESRKAIEGGAWRPAVSVDGRDIVLAGERGSAAEVDSARRALAAIPGVHDVQLRLTDPPPPAERAQQVQTKVDEILKLKIVEFETSKADLTPVGKATLDEILPYFLKNGDVAAAIEGHTDSRGDAALNQQLSRRRAETVKQYLITKGVAAGRLTAAGFGPSRPIADNTTDAGRQRNRRIEFKVRVAGEESK